MTHNRSRTDTVLMTGSVWCIVRFNPMLYTRVTLKIKMGERHGHPTLNTRATQSIHTQKIPLLHTFTIKT
jgi:hypothetical protein